MESQPYRARCLTHRAGDSAPPSSRLPDDSPHGQLTLLYDLSRDPGEQNNLARDHPDIVDEMEEALARWQSELAEPMWPSNRSTIDVIDGITIQLFF